MTDTKVRAVHLERQAFVYVRQSTQHQVLHHKESQERQYELTTRACSLGWASNRVVVIDDDLGKSAGGLSERLGFERLVSEVALGRAGIVLGLEVSRLARNNRDWYHLLDLCTARQTLIADTEGIYDTAAHNDRLLLGLKGTMSEAELHVLRGRMLDGLRHKAHKGELQFHLPAGYEHVDGVLAKTNDEEVSHLVMLVFAKAVELGSVSGVAKYLEYEGLLVPRRRTPGGTQIRWVKPYYRAVYLMLINPIYAGAYAYGRSEVVTDVTAEGVLYKRRRAKPMAEWDVLLHDHHPAYVTWAMWERIQRMLEGNRPSQGTETSKVVREGPALLQGIVRCGRCGRAMTIEYNGRAPSYVCSSAYAQRRMTKSCQRVGGHRVDATVARTFLDVLSEGKREAHLAALERLSEEEDGALRQLELQLTRARYEAQRIERQYTTVEPENRLVARTLETRWNAAMEEVAELERHVGARRRELSERVSPQEKDELCKLTTDLDQLWQHPSVSHADRKRLLRCLVEEVQLHRHEHEVDIKLLWHGGATTTAEMTLPRRPPPCRAAPDLIELIRELAKKHTDAEIARVLVRRGLRTPKQLPFTTQAVAHTRHNNGIPVFSGPSAPADTYTVEQAAELFSVSTATIYSWLKLGILAGEQVTSHAPWSIKISEADRQRLGGEVGADWLTVNEAARALGVSKQTILNWVKADKISYAYANRGRRRGIRIDVKSATHRPQPDMLDQTRDLPIPGDVV